MKATTALIVDEQLLFAEVLASILEAMDIRVIGCAESRDAALELARQAQPTIVLIDLQMVVSDIGGVQIARQILAEVPGTRVVAVTDSVDPAVDTHLVDAGISGFVLKDGSLSRFRRGIRAVLDGDVLIPEPVAARNGRSRSDDGETLLARQLTLREREVLGLLVEGVPGRTIAMRLGISSHTVRTHVQSILSKLQVHSRLEAAAYAVSHGLVDVPGRRQSRPRTHRESA
jgi:two-component system, NarL family, nitrate/nitrite response regulator NarL